MKLLPLNIYIRALAGVLVTLLISFAPLIISVAYAQGVTGTTGFPTTGSTGETTSGVTGCDRGTLCNPLAVSSVCDLIMLLLRAAIAIGIPIAILFIVYAGFKLVMARGNPGELGEARNNLVATLIGIAIFVGASLIANVIVSTLEQLGATGVSACTP